MLIRLNMLILLWLLTVSAADAQPHGAQTRGIQSQDRIDGIQDERIAALTLAHLEQGQRITYLSQTIEMLTAALNKAIGAGIGIGALVAILQVSQLIQGRKKLVSKE